MDENYLMVVNKGNLNKVPLNRIGIERYLKLQSYIDSWYWDNHDGAAMICAPWPEDRTAVWQARFNCFTSDLEFYGWTSLWKNCDDLITGYGGNFCFVNIEVFDAMKWNYGKARFLEQEFCD